MATTPSLHQPLVRLGVSLSFGLVVGIVTFAAGAPVYAPTAGWLATAALFLAWTWGVLSRMTPEQSRDHARAEDLGRATAESVWLVAVLGSLVGVGFLLAAGSDKTNAFRYVQGLVGFASVAASWFVVHLVFMLRYAREWYGTTREELEGNPPIDFNTSQDPDYHDFAYFSYCLGMTYQVSDTNIFSKQIRRLVTRHTLLSYLLGAIILACAINLVVQLAST